MCTHCFTVSGKQEIQWTYRDSNMEFIIVRPTWLQRAQGNKALPPSVLGIFNLNMSIRRQQIWPWIKNREAYNPLVDLPRQTVHAEVQYAEIGRISGQTSARSQEHHGPYKQSGPMHREVATSTGT